jgi:hypothetical protein
MSKFIIEPHFRLQEWVAEKKGYFRAEGLDYEFRELIRSSGGQHHNKGAQGAFQGIEQGREADVSCACHWTVAVAASDGHARLHADAYSVAPAGIFVPADSAIRTPADLAGVPISVGFQSGSHYSTIQALEQHLARDQINLTFENGMLFRRLELLIDGKSRAAALFSGPHYLAEQLGFRKVIDTTFMIAAMINGTPDSEDVRTYFRALKRAQRDIDLRPELYSHYCRNEFPERYHAMMDTRRWGRASESSSSLTPARRSKGPLTGSAGTRSSPKAAWARATTTRRRSRLPRASPPTTALADRPARRRSYSAMTFASAVGPTPTAKRCTSRADGAIRVKVIAL